MCYYFEFGPVVQEKMLFKDISHLELSGHPFVRRGGTICAIWVGGIFRNNSVKDLWHFDMVSDSAYFSDASQNCPIHKITLVSFVCLIWFFTPKTTIFQLCWDGSSWIEPVLSKDKCVLLKDTTQWFWRGSNLRPPGLGSSTLPLSSLWHVSKSKLLFHLGLSKKEEKWCDLKGPLDSCNQILCHTPDCFNSLHAG